MNKLLALSVPGYGNIEAPAQVPNGGLSGPGNSILQTALTLLFVAAIIVALFMLIYSGIQWILSRGDKAKLESARLRILFSIIGLVVIFLSFAVVGVVGSFFGVKLLDLSSLGGNKGSSLGTYQNQGSQQGNQNTKNGGKNKGRQKGKRKKR